MGLPHLQAHQSDCCCGCATRRRRGRSLLLTCLLKSMNRHVPCGSARSDSVTSTVLCGAVLLLCACCLQQCEGFAPPLNSRSNRSNTRRLSEAARPRAALSREGYSGTILLTVGGEGWAAKRGAVATGTFPPAGLLPAAAVGHATATAAAAAAATDFEDPLGGESEAATAVIEGREEKAAPKKKKASTRKKVRCEERTYDTAGLHAMDHDLCKQVPIRLSSASHQQSLPWA